MRYLMYLENHSHEFQSTKTEFWCFGSELKFDVLEFVWTVFQTHSLSIISFSSTYIVDILEELPSEFLEGLLLVLRLWRDDSVKVIAKILSPQTQIILNIWPSLLVYQLLDSNNFLGWLLCPLCCFTWCQWLKEEPFLQWQVEISCFIRVQCPSCQNSITHPLPMLIIIFFKFYSLCH